MSHQAAAASLPTQPGSLWLPHGMPGKTAQALHDYLLPYKQHNACAWSIYWQSASVPNRTAIAVDAHQSFSECHSFQAGMLRHLMPSSQQTIYAQQYSQAQQTSQLALVTSIVVHLPGVSDTQSCHNHLGLATCRKHQTCLPKNVGRTPWHATSPAAVAY